MFSISEIYISKQFSVSFSIQVKGQHHDFLVEDKARADERREIIDVVQDMIEHHSQLFEVLIFVLLLFVMEV